MPPVIDFCCGLRGKGIHRQLRVILRARPNRRRDSSGVLRVNLGLLVLGYHVFWQLPLVHLAVNDEAGRPGNAQLKPLGDIVFDDLAARRFGTLL